MADLIVTCKCGQQMKVPEAALGKTGTCVGCGKRLKITKRNTQAPKPERLPVPVPKERLPASPLPEPTDSDPLPENEHEEPQEAKQGQERGKPAATLEAEGKEVVRMTKRGWFWCVVVAVVSVSLIRAMIMDATNPELIKKRAAPARRQAAPTAPAVTQQRIKGSHWWGCTDRDYRDKLTGYLVDGDMAAFETAWAHGKIAGLCVTFTDGELVYVADTAIWSGLIKVRRRGGLQEYWTNIEALGR